MVEHKLPALQRFPVCPLPVCPSASLPVCLSARLPSSLQKQACSIIQRYLALRIGSSSNHLVVPVLAFCASHMSFISKIYDMQKHLSTTVIRFPAKSPVRCALQSKRFSRTCLPCRACHRSSCGSQPTISPLLPLSSGRFCSCRTTTRHPSASSPFLWRSETWGHLEVHQLGSWRRHGKPVAFGDKPPSSCSAEEQNSRHSFRVTQKIGVATLRQLDKGWDNGLLTSEPSF